MLGSSPVYVTHGQPMPTSLALIATASCMQWFPTFTLSFLLPSCYSLSILLTFVIGLTRFLGLAFNCSFFFSRERSFGASSRDSSAQPHVQLNLTGNILALFFSLGDRRDCSGIHSPDTRVQPQVYSGSPLYGFQGPIKSVVEVAKDRICVKHENKKKQI